MRTNAQIRATADAYERVNNPAEREMTANELLEVMCANSADNKASLYDENVKSVSGAQFWMATSTSAGDNNWLEEIVLPNCTSVKYRTFYRCAGLKRLILPALASCTAASSFQYLSSIEELDIGNVVSSSSISLTGANVNGFTVYIGNGYYSGLSSGLLSIPNTVTGPVKIVFNGSKVGNSVLRGMTHRVDVEVLSSVTSLGDYSFRDCTGLKIVTLPERITSIGEYCFYNCTGLTSITIPESVTSLGNACFRECTGLTSITLPESITLIGDSCFRGCTGLTSVMLPRSVTSLGAYSFYSCTGLKKLIIPSLITCGSLALNGLSSIEELDIGNVVCSSPMSLTGANVNGFTVYIGNGYYYSGIDENKGVLNIPDTVTGPIKIVFNGSNVGKNVLRGMTHQVDVEILSSVTSLGASCFYYCTGMTSITIPESVTSLGGGYLLGCTGLTSAGPIGGDYSYKFGWTKSIPAYAFGACESLTSVTLPESVTSLGDSCFQGCKGLTGMTLPEHVTSLGDSCFYGCTGLTSVTLPESVTSLGRYCFNRCTGLTSITIPESVTSLDVGCFNYCTGLTSITSRAIVPPTAGSYCFSNVNKSIPVYVPAGSVSAYKSAAEWKDFTNIQAIPETV